MISFASERMQSPVSPTQDDLLGDPFRVDSITEVSAPEGRDGIWQRYVIMQGANMITGLRSGTRYEVSSALEKLVERLNERFRKRPSKVELG